MHEYVITVSPNGKFLFRTEGIHDQGQAKAIVQQLTAVYGECVTLIEWTKPMGREIKL